MKFKMLQIIDVSSYLYAGMGTRFGATAQYKGIPTGGIYGVLQQVAMTLRRKDIPVLIFDSVTNAREIMPEYKGSRSRNPKVRFQNDLIYRYLRPALNNTFKVEGYEADWIAFNLAEKYRANDKLGFCYRTTDYDWCHNIVSKRDIMVPSVGGYAEVTTETFERIFSDRDYRVPLNSLTAKKCFMGDKSDGIAPFKYPGSYSNEDLINIFVGYCKNNNLDNRSKETMQEFIYKFGNEFGDYKEELLKRSEILYPRIMDDLDYLDLQIIPKDIKLMSTICSITGCKSIAKRLGINFNEDMGELQREVLREYQQKYSIEKTQLFEEEINNTNENIQIPSRGGFNL